MKRFGLSLVAFAITGAAMAQTVTEAANQASGSGILGTKLSSPVPVTTSGTSGVGVGALIQLLVALGIVAFLLKYLLPKVAGKLTGKFQSKATGGIKLEETVQIPGGALHIVTARGRTFLVGSTPQAIQHLAELTEVPSQPEVDPFEATLLEANPFDLEAQARAAAEVDPLGVYAQNISAHTQTGLQTGQGQMGLGQIGQGQIGQSQAGLALDPQSLDALEQLNRLAQLTGGQLTGGQLTGGHGLR
jgi:flagellar biogenesis protein FliO